MSDRALYMISRYCNKINESTNSYNCNYSYDYRSLNFLIEIYDGDNLVLMTNYNTGSKMVYTKYDNGIINEPLTQLMDKLQEYAYVNTEYYEGMVKYK